MIFILINLIEHLIMMNIFQNSMMIYIQYDNFWIHLNEIMIMKTEQNFPQNYDWMNDIEITI